jgi:serine phosphatase RsbU (regulator of sigma subunit)
MNSRLEEKLLEVQELSEKTIAQERITQQILASQNEQLELQVKQRTFEIQDKNDELSQQNEEIMAQRNAIEVQNEKLGHTFQQITDSVRYAQRIQRAILGDADEIVSNFADAFIFFKPRDIVSGDFYWFASLENVNQGVAKFKHENSKSNFEHCCTMKLMIAADCTGHGVPGAFMTIMGNDFLDDIIISQGISRPDKILYALDNKITTALQRGSKNAFDKIQDGMDIAVIALDEINNKLYYAGAKNPLWYVRNGEIHQVSASKFPIGSTQYKTEKVYECHEIDTQVGDIFYIFTDGYQDQFGYENKQKYMKKRFREFLLSISHLGLTEQKAKLEQEMEVWSPQNSGNQTDDMLVIGIKI